MSAEKKCDFTSKVVEKNPCSIVVDIEVAKAETDAEYEKVFAEISKEAKLPGFRQGKVPLDKVKAQFSGAAKERVIENMVRKTIFNALGEHKFTPIDFPVIEEVSLNDGECLKYRFKAECNPELTVTDYKGIAVKKEILTVTDANVNAVLENLADRNAKLVPSSDGIVKENSFVSVDYQGFDAGVQLDKVQAKNHMLDLSNENTVKDFKALAGVKAGDVKDIEVTYPADYINKDIAGKKIIFKTTVLEIKEKELPKIDDEFAKDMGTENLEDLKSKIKQSLETEEVKRQKGEVERQIVEHLLEKNKFEVPKSLVEQQKKHLVERMKDYLTRQGAPKDFVDSQTEQAKDKYSEEADKNVRLSYILNMVAKQENLQVTDEDLTAEAEKMKQSNPGREADVEKYFNEHKNDISYSIKEDKIFKFLVDNAKISETTKDMPVKK
jgi:trigger factor